MLIKILMNYSLGIFVGFASFFIMEKTLRVLGGGEEAHGHSHSHSSSNEHAQADGTSTAISTSAAGHADGLKSRKSEKTGDHEQEDQNGSVNSDASSASGPSKMSAYLNLFGDFVHNMYVNHDAPRTLPLTLHN